ncbi:MAG: hypothetical protein ACTSPI_04800 [Candidatus Heimdallarchaeaceae archaeon]
MKLEKKLIGNKGLIIALMTVLISSMLIGIPTYTAAGSQNTPDTLSLSDIKNLMNPFPSEVDSSFTSVSEQLLSPDIDLGDLLVDNPNDYHQTYQPWKSQAAVRCIAVTDDYEYMAVGGGYLYDNEVQVYRWNPSINQYTKVWVSGDDIIKSDVIDVDFGDTDNNDFLEIVAASADGHFYVFEQQHIFDPNTNTENMFEHVYTSPYIGQVWGIEVNDTDLDHLQDIIVVSWDYKIHVYEYWLHSGYPFNPEHWITYKEKWVSHNLGQHPTSLVVGDTNYNGLPDMVIGTREGGIFVFENNGTVLDIYGQPYPLTQDNSYKQIYNDNTSIWKPIYSMDIGNLDGQSGDEVVIASFAFNGYILRYSQTKGYYLQKLIKDFEAWTLKDFYPADYFIDNGSAGQNVYFNDPNYTGTSTPEPIPMSDPAFIKGNYPYNTGAAQDNDTCYTYFESNSTHSAWEIYDFGADEEGTGNGNDAADLQIKFKNALFEYLNLDDFIISISPDYEHWIEIPHEYITKTVVASTTDYMYINIDPLLIANQWDYYRYINVTVVYNATNEYNLVSAELLYVHQTVSTALSAAVGTLITGSSASDEEIHALLGTVDGRIVAFKYDEASDEFILSWDSWVDDRFTMGLNIWALKQVKNTGVMPVIYGATDLGTNYLLEFGNQPIDQITGVIADYVMFNIDGDSPATGEFIMSNNAGDLYVFSRSFEYDAAMTTDYFSDINAYASYTSNLSVGVAELDTDYYGQELLIGYFDSAGTYVYDDYYDDSYTSLPADIHMWYKVTSVTSGYAGPKSLSDLEITGQLTELMKNAQSIPSATGIDIDSDGDMDLAVCIGKLYLLWNVGTSDEPEFILDAEYFEDVNAVQGKRQYTHPQFVEFDHDGDYDLVLSYSNRVGATYFDNYGTATNPKWEEKKELMNNFDEEATINVYNFTRPLWITYYEYDEYATLLLSQQYSKDYTDMYYFVTMIDDRTGEFVYLMISYDIQTSYMVAVNPAISRIELNTFKSEIFSSVYKWRNFGFRAIESWSTSINIYNWTLTVDAGDIDQDGQGEIIIGDFDSNIYIFEHMTNNTYKRAFRSPDMLQFIATDETPYSWDQFGGYEGEFNQTFWNHVSYLVINADSDNDGYLEIAALAGTVLYVFEATDVDDTYTIMYRYDVLRNAEGDYLRSEGLTIPSGLTWAQDLDLDGYGEFIIAFESQVLVYEPYLGKLYELFGTLAEDDPIAGHYNLPGNSHIYDEVTIAGIRASDIDRNGVEELIIYGSIDSSNYIYDVGYLIILEYNDLGYEIVWELPSELLNNNKILTLEIADQDYDGKEELLIGSDKGVLICEFIGSPGSMDFEEISLITGHMNYPAMSANSILGDTLHDTDGDVKQRQHDVTEVYHSSVDAYQYLSVFCQWNGSQYSVYYIASFDGINWGSAVQIDTWQYNSGSTNMYLPTTIQTPSGRIYIAWVQGTGSFGSINTYGIWVTYTDDSGFTWSTPTPILLDFSFEGGGMPIRSPCLYVNDTTDDSDIGVAYLYRNSTHSFVKHYWYDASADQSYYLGDIEITKEFNINGIDLAVHPDGELYGLVMSANKPLENRQDYDIWYIELNSTFQPISDARKIVDSPSVEHTPSIDYLKTGNHAALVTFDSAGLLDAMTTTYGVVSDNYVDWSEPDKLTAYPSYFSPATEASPNPRLLSWGLVFTVTSVGLRAPKVVATHGGSFALLTKFDVDAFDGVNFDYDYCEDLIFQIYSMDFTSFTALNKATDIAFGDSDRDGLKELLVADGNRAKMFELISTAEGKHYYQSNWYSPEHDNLVSDVAIYDTNGNKFPELIYSVQGEDVYVYETIDLVMPISDMYNFSIVYDVLESNSNTLKQKVNSDINNDGIPDMVVAYNNGYIYAIQGNTGSVIWEFIDNAGGTLVYLAESIYNNNSALIAIYLNGTTLWLNKTDGEVLTSFTLEFTSTYLIGPALMLNMTNDATMDIIISQDDFVLMAFDGSDGSYLDEFSYSHGAHDIDLAVENGEQYIIVSYAWLEWQGPLLVIYDVIVALNMSLDLIWSENVYHSTLTGSKVYVDDVDGDGSSEFYVVGNGVYLYDLEGGNRTKLWGTYNRYIPYDAVIYDVNNDGIKDVIVSQGLSYGITAYDGRNGNITWYYSPDLNVYDLELSYNTSYSSTILYFSTNDSEHIGIGALSVRTGGLYGYYNSTDTFYLNNLVATTINSEPAVLCASYNGKIVALQLYEPTENEYHTILDKLAITKVSSITGSINPNTILYEDFDGDGSVDLFYVENGNHTVLYSPYKQDIAVENTLDITGNITYALPANLTSSANCDAIYIVTDDFKFGYLSIKDGLYYKEIGDYSNDFKEITAVETCYLDGDVLIIGYLDVSGNYAVNAWDMEGNKIWGAEIALGSSRPDQLNAGHLLDKVGSNGKLLVITSFGRLIRVYVMLDGTLYDTIRSDGDIGFTAIGDLSSLKPYQVVYYRYNDVFYCYSAIDLADLWSAQLDSNAELLSITTGYVPYATNPTEAKVFVSQNGTSLYAFDYVDKLLWKHKHNSFVTKYLNLIEDEKYGTVLLANDYHRTFVINASTAEVLAATRTQFKQVLWLDTWYDEGTATHSTMLFAGNTFYSRGIEFSASQSSNVEETNSVSVKRIMQMTTPAALMMGVMITLLTIVVKKNKIAKLT